MGPDEIALAKLWETAAPQQGCPKVVAAPLPGSDAELGPICSRGLS
jgi:hypothetical protein